MHFTCHMDAKKNFYNDKCIFMVMHWWLCTVFNGLLQRLLILVLVVATLNVINESEM